MGDCIHNQQTRYQSGFWCEDCEEFFSKDSPTYRKGNLLDSIWMTLNNINVDHYRAGKVKDPRLLAMMDKIGISENHEHDYEEIISEAESLMSEFGKNAESSMMLLGE